MSSGGTHRLRLWLFIGGLVLAGVIATAIFLPGIIRRIGLPYCGNGTCDTGENAANCPDDCGDTNWLPDAVHHHFVCGNGTVDPGEECEAEADCPGVTNHCNREICQCVPCAGMPLASFPDGCSTDEQCVEAHGEGWFCNQAACNCMSCPVDSDGCHTEADCPGATDHCLTATCECVTCAEMPSPPAECSTDEQCIELRGEGWFCNQAACSCMSCPEGSDGCHTDAYCQERLGDPTAYCFLPNCECRAGCGDGWCDVSVENSDLCPEDCECVDNGECEPGEGLNCADCGEPEAACGAPCQSTDDCREGLSCFNGACWDDCICESRCGEEPGQEPGSSCTPCQGDPECHSDRCPKGHCVDGCCVCE
jgi:hypothetical protein